MTQVKWVLEPFCCRQMRKVLTILFVSFWISFNNTYLIIQPLGKRPWLLFGHTLQHFDVYVGGGVFPVVVYSDYNPLTFLHSTESKSAVDAVGLISATLQSSDPAHSRH